MRLNSIKLAGFKSFAEPTTFVLPGQLVGVVGPNGCGKSNIIDAVRWVLGESRASELRGDSMQDVIFAGSTERRPAGRASVELVFNNDSQRAGGQWNQYTELAVRRTLTREGASSYYINNQQVRRRDVQDVFLGTGLGPRAYAIIGQGTINRILESKPEELRLFLEEAAGVSKYKERRRETEARLRDTRDNLSRIEDILRELDSSLKKLQVQAEIAARFTDLEQRAGLAQQQLWLQRQDKAARDLARTQQAGSLAMQEMQAQAGDIETAAAQLETLREGHYSAGEQVNAAQGALYEASAEVGRHEAEIRFVQEGRQRAEQRIATLTGQISHWREAAEQARQDLMALEGDDASASERSEILAAQLEEHGACLPDLEHAWQQARQHADHAREQTQQLQQQQQVLAAEQRGVSEQLQQQNQRLERARAQAAALAPADEQALEALQQAFESARQEDELAQAALETLEAELPQLDETRRLAEDTVQAAAGRLASLQARLGALSALQEKVQADARLAPWLQSQGLQELPQLWQLLQVDAGWEQAIEAVLRERMAALPVAQLDSVRTFADNSQQPPARLVFYTEPHDTTAPDGRSEAIGLPALADRVRCHVPALQELLAGWLHGCYGAGHLDDALALRARLLPGEQILLPQGHAIMHDSLAFYSEDSEQAGLLARAQEIEALGSQCEEQNAALQHERSLLAGAQSVWQQAGATLQGQRAAADQARQLAHRLQVDVLQLQQQAEQTRGTHERLAHEQQDLLQSLQALEQRRNDAQERLEELDALLAGQQQARSELDDAVVQAERRLQEAREQLHQLERQLQQAEFGQQSIHSRRQELQRSLQSACAQLQTATDEQQAAGDELTRLADTGSSAALEQARALKTGREEALQQARRHYDEIGRQLRTADEQRLQRERAMEPLRQRITDLRLKEQAAQLAWQQFEDLLQEAGADKQAVRVTLTAASLEDLQTQIDRMKRQMEALGPVNLAALQELEQARERNRYLAAQAGDLREAMATLEQAIATIDGETRQLLQETFHAVNRHFGEMFPELFGGGQARLVMSGEDILDSGVQVLAQPPGKRNQTIQLLSGGEKALTAIALVFAIFQLNPAPFCLLDEVDAPLDDANTERYARLVKRMSSHTQFLFISHNKLAMEIAEQLIGVTMQERGVSRIVAVDMQAALDMTAG